MGNIDVRIAGNSRFCIQFRNYTRINSEWKSWSVGVQRRRRKKNILKRFKLGSILTTCWGSILNTLYSVERVGLLQLLLWRCQPRTWKYSRERDRDRQRQKEGETERQTERQRETERETERESKYKGAMHCGYGWFPLTRTRVYVCSHDVHGTILSTDNQCMPTRSTFRRCSRMPKSWEERKPLKEHKTRAVSQSTMTKADWRSRGLIVPSPPARSSIVPAVLTSVTPRTRTRWCVSTKLLARASCVRSLPYRAADVCC